MVPRADAIAAALLAAWTLLLLLRIRYGFDLTDEGFYLAVSDRLARGDLPFRDGRENILRSFDVVLSWAFMPFGGVNLITARCLGVAMQVLQTVALWLVVRRLVGAWGAAVACALVPCVMLRGLWTPGYNEIACTMTVVAACCLAVSGSDSGTGSRRWAAIHGAVAGVALGLAWISYAPTAALGVVPVLMAAWGFGRGRLRHPWVLAGTVALLVAGLVVALVAVWIVAKGLGPAFLSALDDVVHQQDACVPLALRIRACWDMAAPMVAQVAVTTAGLALLRWATVVWPWARQREGWIIAAGLVAAFAYNLGFLLHPNAGTQFGTAAWVVQLWFAQMVIGTAAALVFTLPPALGAAWKGRADVQAGLAVALGLFAVFAAVTALSSTLRSFNALHIRCAVMALGVAGVVAFVRARAPGQRAPIAVAGTLCLTAFAGTVACALWSLAYLDDNPAGCTAAFTRAPLAGVSSSPRRVAPLAALQAWVDAHVPPDARMIAYHDIPGVYYATRRLPAIDWSWTSSIWMSIDAEFLPRLLTRMEQNGRTAQVCVRNLAVDDGKWPAVFCIADPLHAYVNAHFQPAWRSYPFEALLPRDAQTPFAEPPVIADLVNPTPFADDARVMVTPGSDLAPGPGGTLVLTCAASGDGAIGVCKVVEHGSAAVALRLRLESDAPDLFIALVQGDEVYPLSARVSGAGPGWDVTFPAGPESDRGFMVVLPSGKVPRTITIRRLSLAEFPAVAVDPASPPAH